MPLRRGSHLFHTGMGRGDDSFERQTGRRGNRSRTGFRRPGLPPAGGVCPQRPAAGPGGPEPRQAGPRGRPRRAGRDGLPGRAPDRAARRRPRGPGLRAPRHAAQRGPGAALHRPDRPARRAPRLAPHRLARARGRGVLPGDGGRAPQGRTPPGAALDGSQGRRSRGRAARRRGALRARGRRGRAPDRGRGRPDGAAVAGPGPVDALHRRDHPGRAGPGDPRSEPRCRLDQWWPGHGQDRGGAAPGRLPPLHRPAPLRERRRAGGRTQRGLHALHRAGAPEPGRGRGGAALPGRGRRRPARDPPRRAGGGPHQGLGPDGDPAAASGAVAGARQPGAVPRLLARRRAHPRARRARPGPAAADVPGPAQPAAAAGGRGAARRVVEPGPGRARPRPGPGGVRHRPAE